MKKKKKKKKAVGKCVYINIVVGIIMFDGLNDVVALL